MDDKGLEPGLWGSLPLLPLLPLPPPTLSTTAVRVASSSSCPPAPPPPHWLRYLRRYHHRRHPLPPRHRPASRCLPAAERCHPGPRLAALSVLELCAPAGGVAHRASRPSAGVLVVSHARYAARTRRTRPPGSDRAHGLVATRPSRHPAPQQNGHQPDSALRSGSPHATMSNSPGLWPAIEEHATSSSLSLLLSTKYPVEKTGGLPTYVLGVNASSWVYEAQICYTIPRAAQSPELGALFSRLARFAEAPLVPLFVFDGPDCPGPDCFEERQWQRVTKRTHALTAGLRQLVAAFGFPHHTAPADAEAELARLNLEGLVDAVVSDDARALLFGARTIIRNQDAECYGRTVVIYDGPACTDPSPPSRGTLLLRTLMDGDGTEVGLRGFTPEALRGLMHSGLGDALLDDASVAHVDTFRHRLPEWRRRFRAAAISLDHQRCSGQRRRKLERWLPADFPDPKLVRQYAVPVTSWSGGDVPFDRDAIRLRRLSLKALATRCESLLGWAAPAMLLGHFKTSVWPGCLLRELWQAAASSTPSAPTAMITATAMKVDVGDGRGARVCVLYDPSRYADACKAALQRLHTASSIPLVAPIEGDIGGDADEHGEQAAVGRTWVPALLLERVCPALVAELEH